MTATGRAQSTTTTSMTRKVFVDTGAFLALTNAADQYHDAAVRCFEGLQASRTLFVTTNFVLDETYTRLQRRAGLGVAITVGERLQSDRKLKIYTVEKTLEKLAWEIFKHDHHHSFSYTDCTSFALMRRRKIREAFTFDTDFASFGWIVHPQIS